MVSPDSFYTGLVCENGHPRTDWLEDQTARAAPYCTTCGAPVLRACPSCDAPIRGDYRPPPGYGHMSRRYEPPAYCHNCGKPYPWTERTLEAARELIDSSDELEPDDKEALKESLVALMRDTPGTPVAASMAKRILSKAGAEFMTTFRAVVTAVLTETVRRELFK
jgi:hypothetical protein